MRTLTLTLTIVRTGTAASTPPARWAEDLSALAQRSPGGPRKETGDDSNPRRRPDDHRLPSRSGEGQWRLGRHLPRRRLRLPRHRARGSEVAEWLNSLGVTAVMLKYRLAPHHHPAMLHDAQRAIRTVRARAKEWGLDPNRVGILGFSAGGHLASTAATHFDAGCADATDPVDRRRAAARTSPSSSTRSSRLATPYGHSGSLKNLLGDDPAQELVKDLSNERQVTKNTPPTFLAHTNDDTGVPAENSLLFALAFGRRECRSSFTCSRRASTASAWAPAGPATRRRGRGRGREGGGQCRAVAGKGGTPGQHLVKDRAKREYVASGIRRPAFHDLRSRVWRNLPDASQRGKQFQPRAGDGNGARRDGAMRLSGVVHFAQRVGQNHSVAQRFRHGYSALSHTLCERLRVSCSLESGHINTKSVRHESCSCSCHPQVPKGKVLVRLGPYYRFQPRHGRIESILCHVPNLHSHHR